MLKRISLTAAVALMVVEAAYAGLAVPEPGSGVFMAVGGAALGLFAAVRAWRSRR